MYLYSHGLYSYAYGQGRGNSSPTHLEILQTRYRTDLRVETCVHRCADMFVDVYAEACLGRSANRCVTVCVETIYVHISYGIVVMAY